jgi:tRNA nucleotidyltransferase (CCA-adding enzyme)
MTTTITLPEKVTQIINQLEAAGFESYAVGGCIRDTLLCTPPSDWDITTSATPTQVKSIFPHTIDTGIQHGTVTVLLPQKPTSHEQSTHYVGFEVTTYRIDGKYEDSRHPKEVTFTPNLSEDLKRRDFTINAMAYNEKNGLIDLYGGINDLNNRIIRCVGNPEERFTEDALRILRALRFSAQLTFTIDNDTRQAMAHLAPNLQKISAERIQTELVKLLTSPNPEYIKQAYTLGITKIILPELDTAFATPQNNPHHMYNVGDHLMHTLMNIPNDKCLRLAALLHDIAKPITRTTDENGIDHFHGSIDGTTEDHATLGAKMSADILKRLKFDNDTITNVKTYIRYHDTDIAPTPQAVRRAMNKIGPDYFPGVLLLKRADALAQSTYKREEKLSHLDTLQSIYEEILDGNQCITLKDLEITGTDLINLGFPKGKTIGTTLNALLDDVIDNPDHNTHDFLIAKAKEIKQIDQIKE